MYVYVLDVFLYKEGINYLSSSFVHSLISWVFISTNLLPCVGDVRVIDK